MARLWRSLLICLAVILTVFGGVSEAAIAQPLEQTVTATNAESGILEVSFNQLPPFQEGGEIVSTPEINQEFGFDVSHIWAPGDLPSNVLKVGDIDTGLHASQFTLGQIADEVGLDLDEVVVGQLQFLDNLTFSDLLQDVPFLDTWPINDLPSVQPVFQGIAGGTLGEIAANNAAIANTSVMDLLSDVPVSDIPNLALAQLSDFEDIGSQVIASVPGLGDVSLGNFPSVDDLAGALNFFALQDIAFGADEWTQTPTPDPVSGGTNGGKDWEAIPCVGGCAHIELAQPGWDGAQWMTKDHRVKDGYGILGAIFDEAGAYRLPFGDAFALQITSTEEAPGTASWGIAFRICRKALFLDLGCTAYFLEVPLGITTQEEQLVLTGLRDLSGGASQPVEAPPGWEALRPETPADVQQVIGQHLPPPRSSSFGGAQVSLDEDCLGHILAVTPTSQHTGAAQNIPIIIEAANKYGLDRAQIAYVLATVRRETGPYGWGAVEEDGRPCDYDGGCGWHGRGYVQLTHLSNYDFVGRELGIDLVGNPELALQPDIAAEVLIQGMMNGWFNGSHNRRGLGSYVSDQGQDWFNARRTVNILDHAGEIAGNAQPYYEALQQCQTLETTRGSVGAPVQELQQFRTGTLIAQEYGAARPGGRLHAGQDIDITQGIDDNFQSYIGGVVTRVGYDPGGYGHYIDIYNAELNIVERVAEGAQLTVGLGDTVAPGQVVSIGESETGVIHLEYRDPISPDGQGGFGFNGTLDPVAFLESHGIVQRQGTQLIPLINDQINAEATSRP